MGVVQEAIADRVGQGGLAEIVVPVGGRQLARDDRGAAAVAILEDLEQVAALLILDGGEAPIALGFVEGLNNKVRVLQRRAYGLRDEEYLRLKILTCMLPAI